MSDTQLPKSIFFAIILVALAQGAYNFSLLPDRLASHFSASGVPNGWMTKPAFFIVYVAMVLIAAVPSYVLGRWFDRLPARSAAGEAPGLAPGTMVTL